MAQIEIEMPVSRASMDAVVMAKDRLIDTLTANRDAHRAIFEQALDAYRARSIEILEDHITRIKNNKLEKIYVALPMPEDHTDDYNRALDSLDWSLFGEVELTMREFDMYVRDNWTWKQEFATTNAHYGVGR